MPGPKGIHYDLLLKMSRALIKLKDSNGRVGEREMFWGHELWRESPRGIRNSP